VFDAKQEKPLFTIFSKGVRFRPDPRLNPDKEYSIRRLSLDDARETAQTITNIILTTQLMGEGLLDSFTSGMDGEKGGIGRMLINFFMHLPGEVTQLYKLLSTLILDDNGVLLTPDDFKNPERFPLPAIWVFADALSAHPDLEDFLAEGQKWWKTMEARFPQVKDFAKKASKVADGNPDTSTTENGGNSPSTSSGDDTD
jgi:hypothetical protein